MQCHSGLYDGRVECKNYWEKACFCCASASESSAAAMYVSADCERRVDFINNSTFL